MNPRAMLSHPFIYHHARQIMSLRLPFRTWVKEYGLAGQRERVADIGCGPADILRYVSADRRPAFYLGLDVSERYLEAARRRARRAGLDAAFVAMDLGRIPTDAAMRREVVDLLEEHEITHALLLGVLHHIDDDAAKTTLNLLHEVRTVRTLVTQDVVYLPQRRLNNRLCDWDRGTFVRTEAAYDGLASASDWPTFDTFWTSPGLRAIRYIHYRFSK